MTTKSMVVLETEIKTNESKLSQRLERARLCNGCGEYYTHWLYDIDAGGYTLNFKCMYEANQTDTHTQREIESERFWNDRKRKIRTVDDPMRIKVLDIVLPFFTMFQLIHKRNRKNSSSSSWLIVSSGWQTTNRLLCIHILCVKCMRWYNTQVSKISNQFFSFCSIGHRWNEADRTQNSVKKKWKPKVLLAFQSSLEQEIKFTNKNEWTEQMNDNESQTERDEEGKGMEFNAHRLVILNSNHIKRKILFSAKKTFLDFSRTKIGPNLSMAIGKSVQFSSFMKYYLIKSSKGHIHSHPLSFWCSLEQGARHRLYVAMTTTTLSKNKQRERIKVKYSMKFSTHVCHVLSSSVSLANFKLRRNKIYSISWCKTPAVSSRNAKVSMNTELNI